MLKELKSNCKSNRFTFEKPLLYNNRLFETICEFHWA